ncbi:MAG: T9SS type A sorting domain-containing protein [Bacteroidales bacterium]
MIQRVLSAFLISIVSMMSVFSQELSELEKLCDLNPILEESSGLIWLNGELWSHNDSGNSNELFQIDTSDCSVSRIVEISNVINTDWEDICADEDYVYIGDFGNNNGDRTDLCIYRITVDFAGNETIDTVEADTIYYHYPNQEQFEWDDYSTNFDCEAMIANGDSLYLFSKNWGNLKSYLYALPKTPGDHSALLLDSLNVEGLVTGAAIDTIENRLVLLGYNSYMTSSFVFLLDNYTGHHYFDGNVEQFSLDLMFHQFEGIALKDDMIMISNETFQTISAGLHRTFIEVPTGLCGETGRYKPYFYPNPAKETIFLKNCKNIHKVTIKTVHGITMLEKDITQDSVSLSINHLTSNTYILEMRGKTHLYTDILIVE